MILTVDRIICAPLLIVAWITEHIYNAWMEVVWVWAIWKVGRGIGMHSIVSRRVFPWKRWMYIRSVRRELVTYLEDEGEWDVGK